MIALSGALSIEHLYDFIVIFAHPEMHRFLLSVKNRAEPINLGLLMSCVAEGSDEKLPEPMKAAFQTLMAYQKDTVRIDEDRLRLVELLEARRTPCVFAKGF